jgi:hypothetical protein
LGQRAAEKIHRNSPERAGGNQQLRHLRPSLQPCQRIGTIPWPHLHPKSPRRTLPHIPRQRLHTWPPVDASRRKTTQSCHIQLPTCLKVAAAHMGSGLWNCPGEVDGA